MEEIQFPILQKDITAYLPHRPPFLFVDRILEISSPHALDDEDIKKRIGIRVIGIKNCTINENLFEGHFPGNPILPGVIMLETMAQVACFSFYPIAKKRMASGETFQVVLVGIDKARFRAPVVPGDSLRIETEITGSRTTLWTFDAKAYVEGKLVAEATFMANLISSSQKQDA